jgi:hypothetical protein
MTVKKKTLVFFFLNLKIQFFNSETVFFGLENKFFLVHASLLLPPGEKKQRKIQLGFQKSRFSLIQMKPIGKV